MQRLAIAAVVGSVAVVACSGRSQESTGGTATSPRPEPTPEGDEPSGDEARFERFYLSGNEAACPDQARGDCQSWAELLANGTLRMDPWGVPGAPGLEGRVEGDALETAIAAFRAPALLALLDAPRACDDANAAETMLVRIGGVEHQGLTGNCNDAPIQAARGAILSLTSAQFADHSLISPPF